MLITDRGSRDQAALRRRGRRARAPRRDHRRAEALPEPLRRPLHAHPVRAPDRPQPRRERHADHQRRHRDAHGDGHQHHHRRAALGHHTGPSGAGIFDLEKSVVDDVAKLVCDPPARYAGTVSGSIPAFAGGVSGTFAWTATISLVLDHLGPAPSGSPGGRYAFFRPEGGTVHLTLDMVDGHCTGHGETDIGVDPAAASARCSRGSSSRPTPSTPAFAASPGIAFAWTGGTSRPVWQRRHAALRRRASRSWPPPTLKSTSTTLVGNTTDSFPGHGQRSPGVVARAAGLTVRVDTRCCTARSAVVACRAIAGPPPAQSMS